MIDELLLQSNADIPFVGAQVTIHNPKMVEIGMITEESYHNGIRFLIFSKDLIDDEDKSRLWDLSDFDIFMSIMNNSDSNKIKSDVLKLLDILFPDYKINFLESQIQLTNIKSKAISYIDNNNFMEFKDILNSMFDMHNDDFGNSYNPADLRAAKIAEKLQKGKKKVAKSKGQDIGKINIFAQYISILAVGEKKDKNSLMRYTVYQLKDEFKRWQLKTNFDITLKARLAGAQDVEEAKNWMEDIHIASNN